MQVSALAREAKELQGKTSQKKEEVKEEKKTSSTEGDTFEIVRINHTISTSKPQIKTIVKNYSNLENKK